MKFRKMVAAVLTFAMTAALVPVAGASGSESVVLDARPNFSEEFVNSTFVDVSGDNDKIFLLSDTGDLWACGIVPGLEDKTGPVGFSKIATDVKSMNFDDNRSVLSIIKEDSSLWATKELGTDDGAKNGFHKIMDNVKQVSNTGASGLAVDNNGDLWAWIGEMAIFNFPVDVDSIPASYKRTSPWGVSVVKPYKIMADVKECIYSGSNCYILKNDGTLLSTGDNSVGMIGNGEVTDEYISPEPYEVMTDVDDIKESNQTILAFKGNEVYAWGTISQDSAQRAYAPVKVETNVADVNSLFEDIVPVQKDGTVEYESLSYHFKFDDVAYMYCFYNVGIIIKNDGSVWGVGDEPFDNSDSDNPGHYGIKELNDREKWWEFSAVQLAGPDSSPVSLTGQGGTSEQPDKTAVAKPTSAKVLVNGAVTTFDAYEINGNNYFKLRDVAHVLSGTEKQFEVTWDGAKSAINLIPNQAYTDVGGEMMAGSGKQQTAKLSTDTVYLNGKQVELTAYTINGNNYFKLRDLGNTFDFAVTWDGASQTIAIDTATGYTSE